MILWKDFVFDEVCGPILVVPESSEDSQVTRNSREPRQNGDLGIRKDAFAIQETRQEHGPARMVGTLHAILVDDTGMEAGQVLRNANGSQPRGKS